MSETRHPVCMSVGDTDLSRQGDGFEWRALLAPLLLQVLETAQNY